MFLLKPAINLVGSLSFRNKLRATALVFGLPLLIALGVILAGVGSRVSEVKREREALAVQIPALEVLASFHRYVAVAQGVQDGAEELAPMAAALQRAAGQSVDRLATAMAANPAFAGRLTRNAQWRGEWDRGLAQVAAEGTDLAELHSRMQAEFRGELDRLNERAGLLVDGDASTGRLINVLTDFVPELVDATGKTARLGALALVKKSLKSSRRTELTLLRGKFDSLVEWSMANLQKVSLVHPGAAARLDDAASRLNTSYLPIQEAMTTKMLDTLDFDLAPEAFLELTTHALDETLATAGLVLQEADVLLGERQKVLEVQFLLVVAVILVILALVIAGFISAYISIMGGLNNLSHAVKTMAAGDLSVRAEISTRDEIGMVGDQFNRMVENLAQRTALLREKTNDIQNMLHHMPQGILTIVSGGVVHHEYSEFLTTIFETRDIRGRNYLDLLFAAGDLPADTRAQVEATVAACLGEDRMNFEFNAHLLVESFALSLPDGRVKQLELDWSPICNDDGMVEKLMVCVRDVTEIRKLEAEAEVQKRELQMIGQILAVSQEKFHEFLQSARELAAANEALLRDADAERDERVAMLFRNMHTIKGNARTYGLLHLTHAAHEAEQAYAELRQHPDQAIDAPALLAQLGEVVQRIEAYAALNEVKLGRKGPGRRANAEKYVMAKREPLDRLLAELGALDLRGASPQALADALARTRHELALIGTESLTSILAGVFDSLPSLAAELGKEAPQLEVGDHGLVVRNQVADLLRNVFMHLYRNSLDHGIEPAAERRAAGKSPAGRIVLTARLHDGRLQLRLRDDGRGLALARIRQKAVERGVLATDAQPSDDAVAQLIFAAGFSTASAVTEVSGRGVGMDAVQGFLRREAGDIRLVFLDNAAGADFRAFETLITLPGELAVSAEFASPARPAEPVAAGHEPRHPADFELGMASSLAAAT